MFFIALLLAQAAVSAPAATPTPVPAPSRAPVLLHSAEPARAKTLSEHAAEMKAKGSPTRRVSFDDLRTTEKADDDGPATADASSRGTSASAKPGTEAAAATAARRRMERAVQKGLEVPERTSSSRRDRARREWDESAEACRRTPGCIPQYRDDASYGQNKPLKTDQELIEDIRRRGFSEPHPLPR